MAVQVNEGKSLKHDGIVYEAGQLIHHLADEVKAELVKLGVVKDLEADATKVEGQLKQDAATIAAQAREDAADVERQAHDAEELARGQVGEQVQTAVNQDVQAAQDTLTAEGQPVSQAGQQTPVPQPTPEQIANDPQLQ